MKQTTFTPQFVEFIPSTIENGVLYISETYGTARHLCACGCGNVVVTPLNAGAWRLNRKGKLVSLSPSIGNWSFPCQSHYWICDNRVKWSYALTPEQIALGRANDRQDARIASDALNRQVARSRPTFWRRALDFVLRR